MTCGYLVQKCERLTLHVVARIPPVPPGVPRGGSSARRIDATPPHSAPEPPLPMPREPIRGAPGFDRQSNRGQFGPARSMRAPWLEVVGTCPISPVRFAAPMAHRWPRTAPLASSCTDGLELHRWPPMAHRCPRAPPFPSRRPTGHRRPHGQRETPRWPVRLAGRQGGYGADGGSGDSRTPARTRTATVTAPAAK